ncbi:MAG: choice-of-anchor D domain-containing protein [Pirellulaceae bacterium]
MAAAPSDPASSLGPELNRGLCQCPICTGQGLGEIPVIEAAAMPAAASVPLTSLPQLSSNPGATAKLYLDFNGHFQTSWGNYSNATTPAYDQDGDRNTWSAGELDSIREIWARVAEDFSPLNIDVTTIDPGSLADRVVAHLAIGGSSYDWYGASAGGVAYIGGFSNAAPNVGYAFANNVGNGNPRYVAEVVSHEAGHLFGLYHQSLWSGTTLVQAYNSGNAAWAPIMGTGYSAERTTWHNGATSFSSTNLQDNLAVLSGSNNAFGWRADDFGNAIGTASALPASGTSVSFAGRLGNNEQDVWSFATTGGPLSIQLSPAAYGPNLDAVLELLDAAGSAIVSANPSTSLGASIATSLAAGTFYLVARSSGGYGNLGQYTIGGTLPAASQSPSIAVEVEGAPLANPGAVNFGSTVVGASLSRTITVRNHGGGPLSLSPLSQAALPAGFSLVSNLGSTTLAAGGWTTFTIGLSAATAGSYGGTLRLASNDPSNLAFDIGLSGSVATAPVAGGIQIVDNLDAGFSTSGAWISYPGQGLRSNIHYSAAGSGSAVARWAANVTPGRYQVAVTWYTDPNRATNAPFAVLDGATRLATAAINQEQAPAEFIDQGVTWRTLGTFDITSSNLAVELSNLANEYVIADAIRIQRVDGPATPPPPPPPPPPQPPSEAQVIDNLDPRFSVVGNWTPYGGQGYQGNIHYAAAGSGSAVARWSATVTPGQYRVAATWDPQANRATDAPFSILSGGTNLGTIRVNQEQAPSGLTDQGVGWKDLGTFNITGDSLVVELGNAANEYVIADGVRIERVGDLPTTPVSSTQVIDNEDNGFSAAGAWFLYGGQGYRGNLSYAAAGSGAEVARWTANVTPGRYQVAVTWYTDPNRATDAPFSVLSGGANLGTVRVNQEQQPADFTDGGVSWKSLGIFDITGADLVVALSNAANEFVIGDAVRIERIGDLAPAPTDAAAADALFSDFGAGREPFAIGGRPSFSRR